MAAALRSVVCALFAVGGLALAGSVRAADLRITFSELTTLVQAIATNAKLYLNNAPGVLPLFTQTSYLALTSNQQYPLPIPIYEFDVLGSTYTYAIKDISSVSIGATPVNSALRLTAVFETDGPEAISGCKAGSCSLMDVLPDIEWDNPTMMIDFVPVAFNGGISLEARKVTIGGTQRPVCKGTGGFFSQTGCKFGLPYARGQIAKLRTELPEIIKATINRPEQQALLAEGLKRYLTVGQAGDVAIGSISIAPQTVTVNFRFAKGNGK